MSLWRQMPDLEQLNASQKNSIGDLLGIRFEAFDDESLTASMPVDSRTHQPFGLLHGGASVVLAESLGFCPRSFRPAGGRVAGWNRSPISAAGFPAYA